MVPKEMHELLEFPCHYQFKAVGAAGEEFNRRVVAAIGSHVTVPRDAIRIRPSSKGNYQAVSVLVTLQSYQQLLSIYAEIRKIPELKVLL